MLVIFYLTAIVLANLSVTHFGPSVSIVNAFLFIGLDLTTRDFLHENWVNKNLKRNMFLLIFSGSLLSYIINSNSGIVAIASFIAFAASASVDTIIYILLKNKSKMVKINGSNVISSAVDSVIFPSIAFGFPLLIGIMFGQFLAKVLGGFVWSVLLKKIKVIK